MITISCHFALSFKIMRITQPKWAGIILLCTAQAIHSVRGDEIDIAYIRCIDIREPKAFELWDSAEDGIRKVQPFDRVQIRDDFTEDTFTLSFSMH